MASFFERVYEIVKDIPRGKVSTYGQIARLLGTRDARRIGHALHANTDLKCPCHRVVFSDGRLAAGYVFGGAGEQKKRLEEEGVLFSHDGRVQLEKCLWQQDCK
ncbi:MGMT family protein [Candidatus Uhrbacteria bacterium]|nr:MGMT family protein [Candidatus Uhrbacteria bacterium]